MPEPDGDPAHLIDEIYETAMRPERWEQTLRCIAGTVGCTTGALVIEQDRTLGGGPVERDDAQMLLFGYDPGWVESLVAHYWALNPMLARFASLRPGQVVTNSMVLPAAEFRRTSFYNEWAGPQGFGDAVVLCLDGAPRTYTTLTLPRPEVAGEFSAAEMARVATLVPHLGRALRIGDRLRRAEGNAAGLARGLSVLAFPLLLLDSFGRVAFASPAAEALLRAADALRPAPGGRLAACDTAADANLQAALPPRRRDAGPATGVAEVVVPGPGGPVLVTVAPLSPRGASILAGENWNGPATPAAVVVVNDLARSASAGPRVAIVAAAYGLTPAEARLLRALVEAPGTGLSRVAERAGMALNTGRTHLQRVFAKTGTVRQAELVRLVLATALRQG